MLANDVAEALHFVQRLIFLGLLIFRLFDLRLEESFGLIQILDLSRELLEGRLALVFHLLQLFTLRHRRRLSPRLFCRVP